MNFSSTPEFDKELKTLKKKWRSLPDDIDLVKKALPLLYKLQDDESGVELQLRRDQFFNNKRAAILQSTDGKEVVKMRLDCASLGNKDAARLVFICIKSEDTITFTELYSKSDKNREDTARIKKYIQ
ncbi:MAG TPA: hypothetical protein VGO98_00060 [Candidatus Saccharimonadales bacterium]|jgi:hypothetical protein|nr:hypothetical protein [Candidatus Saccharimonadales bacterium]